MPLLKNKLVALLADKNFTSLFLISFGLMLIGFVFGWRLQEKILSFNARPAQAQEVKVKNIPVKISIPKSKISLDIDIASIRDGVWDVSQTRATYLDISAGLGQGGNTVVYGHNKNAIFGPIRWLEKGDEIVMYDQNGNEYKYVISETITTNPDAIEYVEPKDKETLTIYTCTGLFDSKRFIIVAYPATKG